MACSSGVLPVAAMLGGRIAAGLFQIHSMPRGFLSSYLFEADLENSERGLGELTSRTSAPGCSSL